MKPAIDLPQTLIKDTENKFEAFCLAAKNAKVTLPDDSEFIAILKRVFAFSDFVSKSCTRNPEMFESLIKSGDLQRRFTPDDYASTLESILSPAKDDTELSIFLRRLRCREMVRIAWRDLAGWSDLSETMTDLSNLADICLDQAVSILYKWQCSEYGTPTGSDGSAQHLVVVGMGKLGGQELNFSSDVDLIFAYPESVKPGAKLNQ